MGFIHYRPRPAPSEYAGASTLNSSKLMVTAPGTYEIIVWEPEGRIADYALVVGDEEIRELKQ